MDTETLRERDRRLWDAFAADGRLPAPAMSENEGLELLRRPETPFLTLVTAGRALTECHHTVPDSIGQVRLANAFMAVLKTVLAKKRRFVRKDAMARSLEALVPSSPMPLLQINYGFWRARRRLAEAAPEEKETYARRTYDLLKQRLTAEPDASALSEFISLGMALARTLSDADRDITDALMALLGRAPKDSFWEKRLNSLKEQLAVREAAAPVRRFLDVWSAELRHPHPSALALGEALQPLFGLTASAVWCDGLPDSTATVRLRVFGALLPWFAKDRLPHDRLLRQRILELLRLDGLPDTGRCPLFRRHGRRNAAGERLRGFIPSVGERLGRGVYTLCKFLSGDDAPDPEVLRPLTDWASAFLGRLCLRFPDDDWAAYRWGLMLVRTGDTDTLRSSLLPRLLRRTDRFWFWDLLGSAFPDRRRACLARALCCGGPQERYMKAVFDEARTLGITRSDPDRLRALARDAETCRSELIPPPDPE